MRCIVADEVSIVRKTSVVRQRTLPSVRLGAAIAAHDASADDGQHRFVVKGGRVVCLGCGCARRCLTGFRSLARSFCPGSLKAQVCVALSARTSAIADREVRKEVIRHRAHATATTGPVLWCTKCRRYSTIGRKIKGLADACLGTPSVGEYGYYQLIKLERGLHHRTGARL